MVKLNQEINPKIIRVIIGLLCFIGIVVEILWFLSQLLADIDIVVNVFYWMNNNHYIIAILVSLIRLSILFAVITSTSLDTPVHIRTQDLMVVRLLRVIGVGFFAYSLIANAMVDNAEHSIEAARWIYVYNACYYLLMGIEAYLLILLLVKSRKNKRKIFIIEMIALVLLFVFPLINKLSLLKDMTLSNNYGSALELGIVGLLFIINYLIALSLLVNDKSAK